MKLGLVFFFCLLLLVPMAHGQQFGAYINPIATRVSNSVADSGPFAFLGNGDTSRMFWGATFGGYADTRRKSTDLGVDVRDSIVGANNAHLNSFLLGLRVVIKPSESGIKPYVEVLGGAATSKSPYSGVHVTRAQYGAFGGVDYPLNRIVDFRAIEVGYGSASTVSSSTVGGNSQTPVPSARLLSVSTGLVFRFHY
jgi:hypothetical protein